MREPPANCDHSEVAGRLTSFRGCAWSHRMRAAASGAKRPFIRRQHLLTDKEEVESSDGVLTTTVGESTYCCPLKANVGIFPSEAPHW